MTSSPSSLTTRRFRSGWPAALLIVALQAGACGSDKKSGGTGIIMPTANAGVSVTAQGARSCELLVEDRGRVLSNVVFDPQVKGTVQRRPPRTGLAFVALADAPFSGSVATLQSTGTPDAGVSGLEVVTARCYDREGKPVATPGVKVQ
jgi:hypothetical protein